MTGTHEERDRRAAATEAAKRRTHDIWVVMGRQYREGRKWRKGGECPPACGYCAAGLTMRLDAAGRVRPA